MLQKVSPVQTCIGNSDLDVSERPPFSDSDSACSKYRKCLQKQILRQKQSTTSRVIQSSSVQYCYLNFAELLEHSRNVSKKVHTEQVQLDDIIRKHAVNVDTPNSELWHSTVQSALDRFENGCLRKLFLEQQLKANNLKNKSSMRDYIAYRPLGTGTQTQEITSLAAQHGSQDVSLVFDEIVCTPVSLQAMSTVLKVTPCWTLLLNLLLKSQLMLWLFKSKASRAVFKA